MRFEPENLDYNLSPYTGLTREHWIEAGKYLLKGVFENIKDFNDPVTVPRKETFVTYPHKSSTKQKHYAGRCLHSVRRKNSLYRYRE